MKSANIFSSLASRLGQDTFRVPKKGDIEVFESFEYLQSKGPRDDMASHVTALLAASLEYGRLLSVFLVGDFTDELSSLRELLASKADP